MSESTPKQNMPMNAGKREKLSLHLTGRANATEKDLLAAVDMWDGKHVESDYVPIGVSFESKSVFLSKLEEATHEIVNEAMKLKNTSQIDARILANKVLKRVLAVGPSFTYFWTNDFEKNCNSKEKKIYETLIMHLKTAKNIALKVINRDQPL
jgi:hypothetical protein